MAFNHFSWLDPPAFWTTSPRTIYYVAKVVAHRVPGEAMPGAAMVELQEDVPVVPAAIHGTQHWQIRNRHPVSIAWGKPMRFEGLPRSGKGYREASGLIQEEIHRLWLCLVE